jgi:ABC-type lipoprotein release transport system permease subunit
MAGKVVASWLFETAPYDPTVFCSISALLLATAAVACLVPGLPAARTDPAVVLRTE